MRKTDVGVFGGAGSLVFLSQCRLDVVMFTFLLTVSTKPNVMGSTLADNLVLILSRKLAPRAATLQLAHSTLIAYK